MTDRDPRVPFRNSRAHDVPNRSILRTFVTTAKEKTKNVSQVAYSNIGLDSIVRKSRAYFDHQLVLLVELTLDFVVLVEILLSLLAALADGRLEFLHARFANRLGHEFVLRGEILQFFERRTEGHGERVPRERTNECVRRATVGVAFTCRRIPLAPSISARRSS